MKREEIIEKTIELFQAEKKLEKLYATTDGQLFLREGHARDWAGKDKDRSYFSIKRSEAEAAAKKGSKSSRDKKSNDKKTK